MGKVMIDGVEVELDEGVDPEEVEKYGADSRAEEEIDLEALQKQAEEDAHLEDDNAEEV